MKILFGILSWPIPSKFGAIRIRNFENFLLNTRFPGDVNVVPSSTIFCAFSPLCSCRITAPTHSDNDECIFVFIYLCFKIFISHLSIFEEASNVVKNTIAIHIKPAKTKYQEKASHCRKLTANRHKLQWCTSKTSTNIQYMPWPENPFKICNMQQGFKLMSKSLEGVCFTEGITTERPVSVHCRPPHYSGWQHTKNACDEL